MNGWRDIAERWREAEPDDDIRRELDDALTDANAYEALFAGHLEFGTAGLRAAIGPGPLRMNRLVVRQAAAGLADYLLQHVADAAHRGVVIGFDARRKSDLFAADTAAVLAARGIRAHLFPSMVPTPLLAWSITELDAAAGVMVTASHNPPADNGYKVYLETGAQIVSPVDADISACIRAVDPLNVPLAPPESPLIELVDQGVRHRYLERAPQVRYVPNVNDVVVAYTALHGVGGATLVDAFAAAGLPAPHIVTEQFEPDGSFPTVSFPNPEELGAMDAVIALAESVGADLAIANDPDADRLGAAIPTASGWRRLGGDEIGWLLADHILRHTEGDDRMVVTTVVSSSMLSSIAKSHRVFCEETFTGFKWIGRTVLEHPDRRFVFGYEQALGYLVAQQPLDKDGITAAILLAEVAACARADGGLERRLERLAEQFGQHRIAEQSIRMTPANGQAVVEQLRQHPPHDIAGVAVASVTEFPKAGLLRLVLADGTRLQIRPSGTEPKVKLYGESVGKDPAHDLDELMRLVETLAE